MDGSLHYANKPERCDDGEFQYDSVSLNLSSINSAQQSPSARGAGRTTSSPAASSYEFPDSAGGGVYTPPTSSRAPLPHAASHITKARRIRLYRNADAFYDGMIVLVTPENYRTFDSLLAYINRTPLADPSKLKKGVRYLFTTDGQLINALDQLENGGSYVCSSTLAFRHLDYEAIRSPTWIKLFKAEIKGIGAFGPDDEYSSRRSFIVPRTICVFRAGPRPRSRVKMLLNRRTARTYDQLLTDIAHAIHQSGSIKNIYATSGRQVKALRDFFLEETVYVAFGAERYSPEQLTLSDEETRYMSKTMARMIRNPNNRTPCVRRMSNTRIAPSAESQSTPAQNEPRRRSRAAGAADFVPSTAVAASGDNEGEVPAGLLQKYELGKVLYKTDAVTVRRCEDRVKESEMLLVMRIFDKSELAKSQLVLLTTEATLLRQMHHPNVVEVIGDQETDARLCQVFELSVGVDLLEYVYNLATYTEKDISKLIAQMFAALQYLHSLNIVHRNVKPTNIIVDQRADGQATLKLYDLGLAADASNTLDSVCGTPTYMAPEMIRGAGYGVEVDVWSGGVISYMLFCGCAPFTGTSDEELFTNISTGELVFRGPSWDYISNLAQDLIVFMLEDLPDVRSSATEVLDHPWVSRDIAAEFDLRPLVADSLLKLIESTCVFTKQPALSLISTSSLDKSTSHFGTPHVRQQSPGVAAADSQSTSPADDNSPPPAAAVTSDSDSGKGSAVETLRDESKEEEEEEEYHMSESEAHSRSVKSLSTQLHAARQAPPSPRTTRPRRGRTAAADDHRDHHDDH